MMRLSVSRGKKVQSKRSMAAAQREHVVSPHDGNPRAQNDVVRNTRDAR
jgi:hypothetical protein